MNARITLYRIFYIILLLFNMALSILNVIVGAQLLDTEKEYVPTPEAVLTFGTLQLLGSAVAFSLCFFIKRKVVFFILLAFPVMGLIISLTHFLWPQLGYHIFLLNPLLAIIVHIPIIIIAVILRSTLIRDKNPYYHNLPPPNQLNFVHQQNSIPYSGHQFQPFYPQPIQQSGSSQPFWYSGGTQQEQRGPQVLSNPLTRQPLG